MRAWMPMCILLMGPGIGAGAAHPWERPGRARGVTAATLVVDGDFESANLNDWTPSPNVVLVSSGARDGLHAAQLGNDDYVSQEIETRLVPDVEYTFVAYVKVTQAGTSWGFPDLRLSIYPDLGTSEYGQASAQNLVSAGWQQLAVTHTFTPAELDGRVFAGVRNFGFDGVSLVDDVAGTASADPPFLPQVGCGCTSGPASISDGLWLLLLILASASRTQPTRLGLAAARERARMEQNRP